MRCLSAAKDSGTSLTMMIPRESGPKACSKVEKETLPGWVSGFSRKVGEETYHFSSQQD